MALLKIARASSNQNHIDSWIDCCGYMACGGELAMLEVKSWIKQHVKYAGMYLN